MPILLRRTRARLPGHLAGIATAAAMLVLAPAFCGAVALANGPATGRVTAAHAASAPHMKDIANTDSAAPPVVVLLSTAEFSRGPALADGSVSLPMSFGQPVAPEDELAATPAQARSPSRRTGSHVSRRQTHLATFSAPATSLVSAEVPD